MVNRYADGNDYMGEHQDAGSDHDSSAPIASLSLGMRYVAETFAAAKMLLYCSRYRT